MICDVIKQNELELSLRYRYSQIKQIISLFPIGFATIQLFLQKQLTKALQIMYFLNIYVSKHFMEASLKFNAFALLGSAWFSAKCCNK